MPTKPRINANGSALTPFIVSHALAESGLHWLMNIDQQIALDSLFVHLAEVIAYKESVTDRMEGLALYRTLVGIPVRISKDATLGSIELHRGDEVLVRIENLAIPSSAPVEYVQDGGLWITRLKENA